MAGAGDGSEGNRRVTPAAPATRYYLEWDERLLMLAQAIQVAAEQEAREQRRLEHCAKLSESGKQYWDGPGRSRRRQGGVG